MYIVTYVVDNIEHTRLTASMMYVSIMCDIYTVVGIQYISR